MTVPSYLDAILSASAARSPRPPAGPRRSAAAFVPALRACARHAVVAEVKVASPSRGPLLRGRDAAELARTYAEAGAAAVSVVTEPTRFQGSLELLATVAEASGLAVLRKDFLTRTEEIDETAAWGASAVLLIARILDAERLAVLVGRASERGLAAVVEVHDEDDVRKAAAAGAPVIGVNNRDLDTFHVDLGVSERLVTHLPRGPIWMTESGIGSSDDVRRLASLGYAAFLVGESLITAQDPAGSLRSLVQA